MDYKHVLVIRKTLFEYQIRKRVWTVEHRQSTGRAAQAQLSRSALLEIRLIHANRGTAVVSSGAPVECKWRCSGEAVEYWWQLQTELT